MRGPEGTIFCDDFESASPLTDRYFEYGNAGGNFISTRYNDFANLRWLGLKVGNIDLFSPVNSGMRIMTWERVALDVNSDIRPS